MKNYNSKFKIIFLLSIFLILYLISSFSFASATLVPCGPGTGSAGGTGKPCEFKDLVTLVENVINFSLYKIAIPLVVTMIVYGGFVIMTAGDSTDKVAQGRKIIQSAIIGVVIALGAWLIISEILSTLCGGSFKPWESACG